MVYVLAAIGALTIAVLAWRAFGAERVGATTTRKPTVAPDDDPDFLRRLDEETRKPRDDE